MEDLTGKQLGSYQLIAPLGEGGMAVVYKAYQPSMERFVALKILPRHFAAEPDFVRRFKQESRVIASLEHPIILPVYDYGEADGYTYIVMRYVEGGKTLADLLQGKPLPLPQICDILSRIADALDYAHSRGVVHRDIKPSNVLIDQQGHLLLSDFGLAKIFTSSAKLTTSGAFIGTPTYASPEQCLGLHDIDGRSDIYSLGVILYEMATGRPPFEAETPMAVVVKHVNDPLPLPRKVNPALPENVELIILKSLAKKRESRYSTAGELAKALVTATTAAAEKAQRPVTVPLAKKRKRFARKEPAKPPAELMPTVAEKAPRLAPLPAAQRKTTARERLSRSLIGIGVLAGLACLITGGVAIARYFPTILAAMHTPTPTGTTEAANIRATQTAPALASPSTAAPTLITTFSPAPKILALAAGAGHTCALTAAGGVKCWGGNQYGELGDGTTGGSLTPVDVSGLSSDIVALAAGGYHTCALTAAGDVKCWGYNTGGQLGDNTRDNRLTPVDVSGLLSGVTALTAGDWHTCALTAEGGVKCWGSNDNGQLGDGTETDRLTPVDVSGLSSGVVALAASGWHTCALTATGSVKCWGDNKYGQLGDGTKTNRLTPVEVSGLSGGVIALASGWYDTCVLTAAGSVKCWGSMTDSSTPMDVSGLSSGVIALAGGWNYICALTTAGGVKCWGNNTEGQLGDGTTTDRYMPAGVIGLSSGVITILTGTPAPSPKPQGTPVPLQGYGLPFSRPRDVVSNAEGLWVLFASRLVKLELVQGENRFRAVEQIEFPAVQSLDWDIARGQYWAISSICGSPCVYEGCQEDCQEDIELINQDGNVTATFTVPQTLASSPTHHSSPTHLAWDGEYLWLWLTSSLRGSGQVTGTLYKLQATIGTQELKLVDSFGLSLQWGEEELHGLAWDGTALWLLDGYILTKLDGSAQPVCRITLPSTMDILWWYYQGITWDGQFLWVTHTGTNNVYRVDPALCE